MDSFTHLVAGALTPLAFPNTPRRAAVLGFGIAAGELPDIDIVFGFDPEALLTLHRGVTHALLWQPLLALLVVVPFYIWMRRRTPALRNIQGNGAYGSPGFGNMWLMALCGVYAHIYLDCMTTFGTQIFLPFSAMRVVVPAVFIVDPILTIPALVLLIRAWRQPPGIVPLRSFPESGKDHPGIAAFSPKAMRIARAGLAWVLLYPLAALGVNGMVAGLISLDTGPDKQVVLLPEPFSPLVWKAVIDEGGQYRMRTENLLARAEHPVEERYDKPDRELYAALKSQQPLFTQFEEFCSYMVQTERPVSLREGAGDARPLREYAFMDMRYLISPAGAARLIGRTDPNFVLEARVDDSGTLLAYRFLHRGKDADTPWTELP